MAHLFKHSLIVTAVCASLVSAPTAQAEASQEEAIGFGTGAIIGAIVGGPVGFIVGAAGGAIIGNEIHKGDMVPTVDPLPSEELSHLEEQLHAEADWSEYGTFNTSEMTDELIADQPEGALLEETPNFKLSLSPDDHFSFTFASGASELSSEDRATVEVIYDLLQAQPDMSVIVSGYTDKRGSDEDNLYLSQKRADSVVSKLISLGLAEDRIITKAYGESQAQSSLDDEQGLANDRRVAIAFENTDSIESFASHEL